MEWIDGDYKLTDDVQQMDAKAIHALLQGTYWAAKRSLEQVECSLKNSLCLGLFYDGRQIGIARVITDYATFSYLCDVVVHPEHRGKGLGKWMTTTLVQHPAVEGIKMFLITKDAQGVYRPLGFEKHPYECMVKQVQ